MTKEEVIEKLVALGKTKEEVAKSLFSHALKGVQSLSCSCPIANYIRKIHIEIDDHIEHIGVTPDYINLGDVGVLSLVKNSSLLPIQQFIYAFDREEFPELIE
jgi:hypothetical protein